MATLNLTEPPEHVWPAGTTTDRPAPVSITPPFKPPLQAVLNDFFTEPAPYDFVLPGLLRGTVGAIVSPGGAGKSMYTVQAATTIAGAADLMCMGPTLGQVVYLPAEDPTIALHHRVYALSKHWDAEQRASVQKNFSMYPLIGREPDLFSNSWFYWIQSLLEGKRVCFLDTLRRFHRMEENDSGQMADVVGKMEALAWEANCSIVFLHHTNKSAAMGGQGDQQQASRGSSVLVDNIRWQMFVAGCSKDDAKNLKIDESLRGLFVRIGISKQNYSAPFEDGWLRRTEGGVLIPAQFATSSATKQKGAPREQA